MNFFERIQGILVDTRFLMYHYNDCGKEYKKCLAECIEEVSKRKNDSVIYRKR